MPTEVTSLEDLLGTNSKAVSIEDLAKLLKEITSENCSIDVIKVALKRLELERIPTDDATIQRLSRKDQGDVQAALFAVALLSSAIPCCVENDGLRNALVEELTVSIDGICEWIMVLLDLGLYLPTDLKVTKKGACFTYAQLFYNFVALNSGLSRALTSSESFVRLLLILWLRAQEDNIFYMFVDGPRGCPIVNLLRETLSSPEGNRVLMEMVLSHPHPDDFAMDISMALVRRVQQARDEFPLLSDTTEIAQHLDYITLLFEVTAIAAQDRVFRKSLRRLAYIPGYSLSLFHMNISLQKTPFLPRLLQPARTLVEMLSVEKPYQIIRNWASIVSASFVEMLSWVLAAIPEDDKVSLQEGLRLLENTGTHTVYRSVAKALSPELLKHLDKAIRRTKSPVISGRLQWFKIGVVQRLKFLDSIPTGVKICDNLECFACSRRSTSTPKECSGCSSMFYCSEECQREDWDQRHRDECSKARDDFHRRRSCKTWYHHSTRSFHVGIVEEQFNITRKVMDAALAEIGISADEAVVNMKCTSIESGVALRVLGEAEHYTTVVTPGYLKPRLHGLIDGYRAGAFGRSMRLAEAIFPFGESEIVDLLVLLERKGEKFEAVYSIIRYGSRPEDADSLEDEALNAVEEGLKNAVKEQLKSKLFRTAEPNEAE